MNKVCYPDKSLIIYSINDNGFIVNTKGTIEEQRDDLDGVRVFETLRALMDFLREHYDRKRTGNTTT